MTTPNRFSGRLAVIGGGKMGEAIVSGLLASGTVPADRITIAEPVGARRDELASRYSVGVVSDGIQALGDADMVILAVKPQAVDQVVKGLSQALARAVLVSIAAGITCARLESFLPEGSSVVRVMPNTPVMVREGMAIVSGGSSVSDEQIQTVAGLFSAVGRAIVVPESAQDAGTAISGSGPAYFALVVDALARAGVAQGLTRDTAQALAVQTMLGTAKMLEETGMHPEALIDGVSSPGGTTIAAINVLEDRAVRAAFAEAVSAAVRRSRELGS
ncbi:MAG: pyrroline-5-carboxylate reductase [Actinobacteria bacterium HGW-Actinobacteria-7]|nr:MAG: pyrroline-5-carboxylate reductase [Actinobacteria bacterium HGW-Actinobacteria-7]